MQTFSSRVKNASSWKFHQIIEYSFLVSAWYALFELYLHPWTWLSFSKAQIFGLTMYHISFMLPFYLFISILPVWRGLLFPTSSFQRTKSIMSIVGTFLLALLFEDILYFAFSFTPIKAGMWTTQWGYVQIVGHYAIPDWYIAYAVVSLLALSRAYSWMPRLHPTNEYVLTPGTSVKSK